VAAKRSKHVRLFWNAATARRREADVLLLSGKSVGAVYLAGYAVECGLKALILAQHPEHRQPGVIDLFRGAQAHSYLWLRTLLQNSGGGLTPPDVTAAFTEVDDWATDLRYNPRERYAGDADEFFEAVAVVLEWITRRLE
jgi:HEPN domain-containing protein